MKDAFEQFVGIIQELIQLFQHLIEVEEGKVEVVRKNQVIALEECMNQEQAAILKLRGLEQKREQLLESMGYGGFTFRRILEECPSAQKDILSPLFQELEKNIASFKEVNDNGKELLQLNLHKIETAMKGKPEKVFSNKLV